MNTLAADLSFKDITTGDGFSFVMYSAPGSPQSLSGWSATAKVRNSRSSASVIITLTSPTNIILTSDSSGLATVQFSVATKATIMTALGSGIPGVWGVEMSDGAGGIYVPVEGSISVTQTVPR